MIRVLVAEDSVVARELIVKILSADPEIEVIGCVSNGRQAVEFLRQQKPDLITMDICMPEMDGFAATRMIMEESPVPIVMVTSKSDLCEGGTSFDALEAGALLVLQKPWGVGHPEHERSACELIKIVKLMSEIKVVRRRLHKKAEEKVREMPLPNAAEIRVIAIGASTGGPPVIQKILAGLPPDLEVPVLIVQHMARGFTEGFVDWLAQTSVLPVSVACDGAMLKAGRVYVAPDGYQMKVAASGCLQCKDDVALYGLKPSVSYLFNSLLEVYGKDVLGVLLTGMGKDGAAELALLRKKGALTIAQDSASSVVFGMPGEAVRLNGASYVLPPEKIIALLKRLGKADAKKGGM